MPTPEPAHRPAGRRRPVAQAREHGAREVLALRCAQAGLLLLPEQAAYLTAHLTSPSDLTLPRLQLAAARDEDAEQGDFRCRHLRCSHAGSGSCCYVPCARELGRPRKGQAIMISSTCALGWSELQHRRRRIFEPTAASSS